MFGTGRNYRARGARLSRDAFLSFRRLGPDDVAQPEDCWAISSDRDIDQGGCQISKLGVPPRTHSSFSGSTDPVSLPIGNTVPLSALMLLKQGPKPWPSLLSLLTL